MIWLLLLHSSRKRCFLCVKQAARFLSITYLKCQHLELSHSRTLSVVSRITGTTDYYALNNSSILRLIGRENGLQFRVVASCGLTGGVSRGRFSTEGARSGAGAGAGRLRSPPSPAGGVGVSGERIPFGTDTLSF